MTHQIDENGAHSGSERQAHGKDKPEHGKVYALTGKSDQPSIARGDSWKKSLVTKKRKEQDAKKEAIDPRLVIAKKKRAMELAKRKSISDRLAQSKQGHETQAAAVAGRQGVRKQQATKHSQKRWKEEAENIVDAVAAQITADFDPRTHKVPRPAGMSKKQFDYKYKPTKVRKPKKDTGMKTPETQAALKYLKGKGPSPYGPGGKYEPKKEEVEMEGVDVYGDAPKRKQHPGQKKGTAKLKKGWKMTPSGEPYLKKESNLPPHLSKFLDKKGNPNKEAQARIDAGRRKREVAARTKDVTPKGYGPSEEVEMDEWGDTSILSKQSARIAGRPDIGSMDNKPHRKLKITQKGLDALRAARDKPKVKTQVKITKKGRDAIKEVEEAADTWHPDPEKDKATTSYKHAAKQMKIRRPGGPLSGNKSKITGKVPVFKHMSKVAKVGGKWMSVPEEHDCNQTHPGMTHTEWKEDQKIEALYAEDSTKIRTKKSRKFRQVTPGQSRDYEKLSAERMFQAYEQKTDEDAPTTNTSGVANWDPLLGDKKTTVYLKKRRKVDGRTKDYRETVQRVQARRDALAARELEQKLNMFGVQSNPFKEETEMENNKKYLKTKEGSIEEAVLKSLMTKTPVNPNDARPTLHLPKNYLEIKEGSIEEAVTNVMTMTDDHVPGHSAKQVKMAKGIANDPRHKGGDMTGAYKKAEKIKKGLGDHPKVQAALRKANEEDENEDYSLAPKGKGSKAAKLLYGKRTGKNRVQPESAAGRGERDVGSQEYTDYVKNLTPGEGDSAVVDRDAQKAAKASQEANKEKKLRSTRIDDEYQNEAKETEGEYGHATALYKDQWKDRKIADYDKEHDKDSRAKEMRADAEVDRKRMWAISKDKWKHAKGASGEEKGKKSEVGNPDPKDAYKKEDKELDEKDWIKGAIKKPGALRRQLDVPAGKNIPAGKLKDASKAGGKLGQRARLAITLKKMHDEHEPETNDGFMEHDHHELGFDTRSDMLEWAADVLEINEIGDAELPLVDAVLKDLLAEIHTAKDTSHLDKAIADFKKKGGKATQVKSKGIPKWAQAAHQKSGPPSAHKMYKPGSGKSEEVEIAELSKKTLGRYVMGAASSSTDAGMALQRSTDKPGGQTRGDVEKHVGTLNKRRQGIKKAVQKLSKEEAE